MGQPVHLPVSVALAKVVFAQCHRALPARHSAVVFVKTYRQTRPIVVLVEQRVLLEKFVALEFVRSPAPVLLLIFVEVHVRINKQM